MNQKFKTRDNNLKIVICSVVIFISICLIVLFSFLYSNYKKNLPLIVYPKYTLSQKDWTNDDVLITITEEDKISEYSFDGGKTFQKFNTYEVTNNQVIYVMVKDIKGKLSKITLINIKNIDKDPPELIFEATTTVQKGSNFSLKNGVQAHDSGSGLSNNFISVPETINTNIAGEYFVTYTAIDKTGNYIEKVRKIIVNDVVGTTYYRYRDANIEYNNCEPYNCNCVESTSFVATKTCPSGYTFEEPNKCCQTCYKVCQNMIWGEWTDWSRNKVSATATREVETKVE